MLRDRLVHSRAQAIEFVQYLLPRRTFSGGIMGQGPEVLSHLGLMLFSSGAEMHLKAVPK